jgi:hypothetical protein
MTACALFRIGSEWPGRRKVQVEDDRSVRHPSKMHTISVFQKKVGEGSYFVLAFRDKTNIVAAVPPR